MRDADLAACNGPVAGCRDGYDLAYQAEERNCLQGSEPDDCLAELSEERDILRDIQIDQCVCADKASAERDEDFSACAEEETKEDRQACKRDARAAFREANKLC